MIWENLKSAYFALRDFVGKNFCLTFYCDLVSKSQTQFGDFNSLWNNCKKFAKRETYLLLTVIYLLTCCQKKLMDSTSSNFLLRQSVAQPIFLVIKQKGKSQNGCLKKTKHVKFSEKRTFLTTPKQKLIQFFFMFFTILWENHVTLWCIGYNFTTPFRGLRPYAKTQTLLVACRGLRLRKIS